MQETSAHYTYLVLFNIINTYCCATQYSFSLCLQAAAAVDAHARSAGEAWLMSALLVGALVATQIVTMVMSFTEPRSNTHKA